MRKALFFFFLVLGATPAAASDEVLEILQDLIRIDTSNPPGNETVAARFVQQILAQEGVESEIIEAVPGRGNLIARLPGDGSGESLILLGHLDVVPADPSEWKVPPFSGEVREGRIWGRGALDMKGMVAMEVAAFLRVKRERIPLKGDLILVLVADEEAGGALGAEFLVRNHWDKIRAKFLFNEGSVGVEKMGLHLYPVQVAEKGVAWMKLTARGTSGHGSMPQDDNAVVHLTRALEKISRTEFPVIHSKVLEAFLTGLAPHLDFVKGLGARGFFHPLLGPVVRAVARRQFAQDRTMAAVLSHTCSPSMLQAGYKVNVIPAEATGFVDCRIMPGESPEGFRRNLQDLVGDRVEVELVKGSLPNESPFETQFFETVREAILRQDLEGVVLPFLSAGATDSRFFREKGVVSYGIIPLLLVPEELAGLHGKDERVPVAGLQRGAEVLYDIVLGVLSQ